MFHGRAAGSRRDQAGNAAKRGWLQTPSHLLDADAAEIEEAVSDFAAALERAGPDAVGFFYYAGHGRQTRYLRCS